MMRLRVLLVLACALAACASGPDLPTLASEERARVIVASIKWPDHGVGARLHPMQTEGWLSGFFLGFGTGAVVGLHPSALVVGGPLLAAPVFAVVSAKCGRALGVVENPVPRLQRIAQAVGLEGLQARLKEELARAPDAAGGAEPGVPYTLDIVDVALKLGSGYRCAPELGAIATWRLVHAGNGTAFEPQETECLLRAAAESFEALFADEAMLTKQAGQVLDRLGLELASHLRAPKQLECAF